MNNSSKKIRLGLFLITGCAVFLFLIVYFTARKVLEKTDTYYVVFHDISISGMEIGGPVKYIGINVGRISDIRINPEDITSIVVTLDIKRGIPVKQNTRADIVTMGITGLKAIDLRGGTNISPPLKPGSYIQAGTSLTAEITNTVEVIAEKVEQILNNLQSFTHPDTLAKVTHAVEDLSKMTVSLDNTIIQLNTLLTQNAQNFSNTIENAEKISESVLNSSLILEETLSKIDQHVLIDDVAEAVKHIKELLVKLDNEIKQGGKALMETEKMLQTTLQNLEEATGKISNNPSVLIRKSKTKNLPDEQFKK